MDVRAWVMNVRTEMLISFLGSRGPDRSFDPGLVKNFESLHNVVVNASQS